MDKSAAKRLVVMADKVDPRQIKTIQHDYNSMFEYRTKDSRFFFRDENKYRAFKAQKEAEAKEQADRAEKRHKMHVKLAKLEGLTCAQCKHIDNYAGRGKGNYRCLKQKVSGGFRRVHPKDDACIKFVKY